MATGHMGVEGPDFLQIARLHIQGKRFDLAFPLLKRALIADPSSVPASVNLLGVSLQNADLPIPQFISDTLNILAPTNPTVLLNKAESIRLRGGEDTAKGWFKRSLMIKPETARAWLKLASIALKQTRSGDFLVNIFRAYQINPMQDDVAGLTVAALLDDGHPNKALEILDSKAGASIPERNRALLRGRALISSDNVQEALPYINASILKDPVSSALWALRSHAHRASSSGAVATADGIRAVVADPSDSEALEQVSMAFLMEERSLEGSQALKRLRIVDPKSANGTEANLGAALLACGQREEALVHLKWALIRSPDRAQIWSNLTTCFLEFQELGIARKFADRALRINANMADAIYNIAIVERFDRNHEAALARARQALELDPDNPVFRYFHSILELSDGDVASGLDSHHHRWRMKTFSAVRGMYPQPALPVPVWDGGRLAGTLAVWGEQGVGDELWFSGFLQHAIDLADHVVLEITPHLVPLMQRGFPEIQVIPRFERNTETVLRGADAQIPIGDLFEMAFKARGAVETGYLKADHEKAAEMKRRYLEGAEPGTRLIGLSWRSRKAIAKRSFEAPIPQWGRVLHTGAGSPWVDGPEGGLGSGPIRFVCLQYGDVSEDLETAADLFNVRILRDPTVDPLKDLDMAAAQLIAMDMVISVANATVCLAHGLGRPCVVPLRIDQDDWRYSRLTETSRWLPLVHYQWQTSPSDWEAVLEQSAREARALLLSSG